MYVFVVLFFVKQKTAYEMRISDWSSDVCSSDLDANARRLPADNAGDRRRDRDRDIRADRRSRAKGRTRHDGQLRHRRLRLRLRGALLRRNGLDGSGVRLRLYL